MWREKLLDRTVVVLTEKEFRSIRLLLGIFGIMAKGFDESSDAVPLEVAGRYTPIVKGLKVGHFRRAKKLFEQMKNL
jgi:hypothetical protein